MARIKTNSEYLLTINKEIPTIGTFSSIDYSKFEENDDSDIFEEVIDQLMLTTYSEDKETYDYIKSLPKKNKRMAILSLLDGDNNMWVKLKAFISNNHVSKVEHLTDVIKLFRDYVKIAEVERKRHGEIMTPLKELALPMIDLVPKEFWTDPTQRIVDSSGGIGTFLIMCAAKLMNGLKKWQPNDELRFKHIVENMLYYGELQPRNAFLWLCAIDPYDEYKTNTYCGSFLDGGFDKHMNEVWKVENFTLGIQNPPYQQQKDGFKKTQPLWHLFVQKTLSLIKEDGYMVMVHPSGWRNIEGVFKETQLLLKSKQIINISIHDEREGVELFGATTGFDYYILKNKKYKDKTKISTKNTNVELDISKLDFIPSNMFDLFEKLIATESDEKVNVLHSFSNYETRKTFMSRVKKDNFIYPCCYTIQKDETINLFYSSKNDNGHFGIPKVIWSNGKASSPIVDIDGTYGLTQFSYAIVDEKENLEKIKMAMNSDKFTKLMNSCDMNDGNRFNRKVLATFKKDFWKEFIDEI